MTKGCWWCGEMKGATSSLTEERIQMRGNVRALDYLRAAWDQLHKPIDQARDEGFLDGFKAGSRYDDAALIHTYGRITERARNAGARSAPEDRATRDLWEPIIRAARHIEIDDFMELIAEHWKLVPKRPEPPHGRDCES